MTKDYAIYVHIPFCKARCGYCAFSSCTNFALQNDYFDALCSEISHAKTCDDVAIRTMFWGGGTPSAVNLKYLQKLHCALQKFDLSNLKEFTVELNPESTTKELLQFLKSIGVNRLSFGLQSANDSTLKKIGRLHNYQGFLTALNLARQCGFSNINADLILGLPESFDEFRNTIEQVCRLPLEHISLYALEIHPEKTAFKALCDSYGYTDDDLADMYVYALEKLEKAGFLRYEVSNFAKAGCCCQHNLTYWREGRYFGFGASASGFVENVRYGNAYDIEQYIDDARAKFGVVGSVALDKHEQSASKIGVETPLADANEATVNKNDYQQAFNKITSSDESPDEVNTNYENTNGGHANKLESFQLGVATEYCDVISLQEEMSEFAMLGLRLTDGVSLAEFSSRFGKDFFTQFPQGVNLVQQGFLQMANGRLFVPKEKFYVLNSILVELLPD